MRGLRSPTDLDGIYRSKASIMLDQASRRYPLERVDRVP
jgi:hypothetical protein